MFFTDLETNRLHLQSIAPMHRYFIYALFTNEDVLRFHNKEDQLSDLYGADTEIAEWNQPEPHNQHGWVLACKADGVAMGVCVVNNWDRNTASCQVHYDMHPDFWGKGYMTEAIRTIIDFAQDKMKVRCIETSMDEENVKSIKLAERLGFEYIEQTVEDERIYRLYF